MLIDTHTHLYLPEFKDEGNGVEAVDRAINAGVGFMILPNVDKTTVGPMQSLHRLRPEVTAMAVGLHPTEVGEHEINAQLEFVKKELESDNDYVAIGEIGIDLYWDKTFRDRQMQIFERQLNMAVEKGLPVIIHCRDGLNETLEVMQGVKNIPGAVFHSFGGSNEDVEKIRKIGDYYFGINGIVTFKNSKLAGVIPNICINRILLETDSPYLAPVPYRGKRNESAYLVNTASKIAESLQMEKSDVERHTEENARALFKLPGKKKHI